jgi:hypothetical protein
MIRTALAPTFLRQELDYERTLLYKFRASARNRTGCVSVRKVRVTAMLITRSAFAAILALVAVFPVKAQPESVPRPGGGCFLSDQFRNWRAADARTIYIRVLPDRYYRLDLAAACPILASPGARLITRFEGKRTVCSPQDWDLSVVDWGGTARAQCVVRTMTLLSSQEVATLPQSVRPQ